MKNTPDPSRPPEQHGLWVTRIAVAFWVVLPFVLLVGGIRALDRVNDSTAHTILGFFVLTGFFGMLAFAQFITKNDQKKLQDWAWERKLYKMLQSSRKRTER